MTSPAAGDDDPQLDALGAAGSPRTEPTPRDRAGAAGWVDPPGRAASPGSGARSVPPAPGRSGSTVRQHHDRAVALGDHGDGRVLTQDVARGARPAVRRRSRGAATRAPFRTPGSNSWLVVGVCMARTRCSESSRVPSADRPSPSWNGAQVSWSLRLEVSRAPACTRSDRGSLHGRHTDTVRVGAKPGCTGGRPRTKAS